MFMRNWEDWAMAAPLAVVAGLGFAASDTRTPSFASDAIAAEASKADYVMTVTAKRLPAECKGVAETALPKHCIVLMDGTTITMRQAD
jgi:hypothetical protein